MNMKFRLDQRTILLPILLALLIFIVHLYRDVLTQVSGPGDAKGLFSDIIRDPIKQPSETAPVSNKTAPMPDYFVENIYKPIFYLKTHKTGSSSIAHSLLGYTRRHSMTTLRAPGHIYMNMPNNRTFRYDGIVAHHFPFNLKVINTYLKAPPKLILTSLRLPLQRQLSWFRQQNKQFEHMQDCSQRNDTLLKYYDNWKGKIESQWKVLQERDRREELAGDAVKIVNQFDFIFLKERLRESYECLCKDLHIRLCDQQHPMVSKNAKAKGSCVEEQLLKYRSKDLVMNTERDMLLYEIVQSRLSYCQRNVPPECRCPELIDGTT